MEITTNRHGQKIYSENPFKDIIESKLVSYKDRFKLTKRVVNADKELDTTNYFIPHIQITDDGINIGLEFARNGSNTVFMYFIIMKYIKRVGENTDHISLPYQLIVNLCKETNIEPLSREMVSRGIKKLMKSNVLAKSSLGDSYYWLNTSLIYNGVRTKEN